MNTRLTNAAGSYLAPQVLRVIRLRWVVYGAAAYFALRFMSQRGIFPKQADAALDVIDHGFAAVKSRIGLGEATAAPAPTMH